MMKIKQTKGILPLVLILAAVFIIEAFFSNFTFFAYVAGNNGREDFSPEVDNVVIYEENRTVYLDIPSFPLNSVSFDLRINSIDAEDTLVGIKYGITDENSVNSSSRVRTQKTAVGTEPKKVTSFMRSQGNAQRLEISFDGTEEFIVSDIKINPQYEFGFNSVRFCLLFVFACLIYVLKVNGNSKKLRDKMSFDTATTVSVFICSLSVLAMWILNASGEDGNCVIYPIEGYLENQSPYVQQFDAFMKGQLHFDIKPTEELLALGNPYSPDAREGIYYLYDRAFFGGKYYSYFGIAPIILIYFPFYLFTGVLPINSTVSGILALIASVFLPSAVVEWAKLRKSNIRPWLAAVCAVGAFFASSVLIIQRGNTPFYYIASLAGIAFVSAFAYWMLKALGYEKKSKKIISFVLAGFSFAFAFLSRLNSVIVPAVMVAVFVIIYAVKKIKEKKISPLITEMAALALPVAAALGFSLWYNNARFGSPLQFGADYQLTIADASLYKLGFDGIIPSAVHYFIQPFGLTEEFPFIGFDYFSLSDYGRYVYIDMNYGIFALPFTLSLFLSIFIFRSKKASKEGKTMLAAGIISLFVTAFANFCLGGVIFRYTSDISLAAALLSAVILLEVCTYVQKSADASIARAVKSGTVALTAVTACISLASCVQINGNLVSYSPEIYEALKNFFVIWS
ncbi:MAG: hypothetical protein IJE19_10110 [Clostridia bacterium]|nr:hypothetical protein [Clostridia bacterium]